MPNIKSAKKRVKINTVKATHNQAAKSALKTQMKKAYTAIESGAEDKNEILRSTAKGIDKAVAKGIMHKNTAARKKSSLSKKAGA